MARYIDADALMEAIKRELWDWQTVDGITATTALKQTITDIQNAPTADVVERKKGKWVEEDDSIIHGHCSSCGWQAKWQETDVFGMKYCPNCGAQMESE